EPALDEPRQDLVDLAARRRPEVSRAARRDLRQVVTRPGPFGDEAENRKLGRRCAQCARRNVSIRVRARALAATSCTPCSKPGSTTASCGLRVAAARWATHGSEWRVS